MFGKGLNLLNLEAAGDARRSEWDAKIDPALCLLLHMFKQCRIWSQKIIKMCGSSRHWGMSVARVIEALSNEWRNTKIFKKFSFANSWHAQLNCGMLRKVLLRLTYFDVRSANFLKASSSASFGHQNLSENSPWHGFNTAWTFPSTNRACCRRSVLSSHQRSKEDFSTFSSSKSSKRVQWNVR